MRTYVMSWAGVVAGVGVIVGVGALATNGYIDESYAEQALLFLSGSAVGGAGVKAYEKTKEVRS